METPAGKPEALAALDEREVRALHRAVLAAWNARDAGAFAAQFLGDADLVGFDGSQMTGRAEIEATLARIFGDHPTGAYVGKVRGVRPLGRGAALLRAVVGMVPAGDATLNPALNAVQVLVAEQREGRWWIALFQNTPAQFHGRPELAQALTEELRKLL
ncbi:MAG: SgcJ/EcaC family oxidoreductase [Candidatus Lambdaproteobacteria bacterium]|nr:SgcJ/EcaC family oxidoreductase [Candidatus Lambdaproteobacteria bacterium]